MASINFFNNQVEFSLKHPRKTKNWIEGVIKSEKGRADEINYIFCSDSYLLDINQKFLNHNTLTDIITFDYSESIKELKGEIYISIDRVKENAGKYDVSFDKELARVMIHGVLHMLGYKDKKSEEKTEMRGKEEAYLSLRK